MGNEKTTGGPHIFAVLSVIYKDTVSTGKQYISGMTNCMVFLYCKIIFLTKKLRHRNYVAFPPMLFDSVSGKTMWHLLVPFSLWL